MTFVVDGTNGLTFNDATTQSSTATNASNISSGTLGKARLPTGSVLQVVQGTYTTLFSTQSTTMIDTGLTASITPTSASSKILVTISSQGFVAYASGSGDFLTNIVRGSTELIKQKSQITYVGQSYFGAFPQYLDSPATTSSTTYKLQASVGSSANTLYFTWPPSSGVSTATITLMEISA